MKTHALFSSSFSLLVFLLTVSSSFILSSCTHSNTLSSTPASPPPPAKLVIQSAITAMQQIKAYHFSLTTQNTNSSGLFTLSEADGDLLSPDTLQASVTGTTLLGKVTVRVIVLGSTQYMTDPITGKWLAGQGLIHVIHFADPQGGVITLLKHLTQLGAPQKGSSMRRPCWQISGSIDPQYLVNFTQGIIPATKKIDTLVCIGNTDHLVYQITARGKLLLEDNARTTRVFILAHFNEALHIQAPTI